MKKYRKIHSIHQSQPTLEGAGVHLRRAFGFHEVPQFDPFLLLDDFRSDNPDDYIEGFPWHPHRGIETITYMVEGKVEHADSLGNKGIIEKGDVQWMTAGNGIIHQEMPKGDVNGRMGGFQLWANLPTSHKMMDPRYQEIKSDQVPLVTQSDGVNIRVICGMVDHTSGPVKDIITDPEYLDVSMPKTSAFKHPTNLHHTVLAYVFEGVGFFGSDHVKAANGSLILFTEGEQVAVTTGEEPVRFLLISGQPINQPIAWYGPIVMNTNEELELALSEFRNGTFIKNKKEHS